MGQFNRFMKQNKVVDNTEYIYEATKKILDDKGKPEKWKFKKLPLQAYETLRESFIRDKKVGSGKNTRYISDLNTKDFNANLIVKCCVYPDLNDKELQDSYGVMSATELLYAIIDDVGEYTDLIAFIQELHGIKVYGDEEQEEGLVQKAKN